MLFKTKRTPAQLAQSEREAIVDLLHLCLYADGHISLQEGQFLAEVVNVIGWDTNLAFSSYESRSIAAARAAQGDERSKQEFITHAAARLRSGTARQLAVSLCRELIEADGTSRKEGVVITQIRSTLGVR